MGQHLVVLQREQLRSGAKQVERHFEFIDQLERSARADAVVKLLEFLEMVLGFAAAAALCTLQVLTEKRLRTNQQSQGRQIIRSLRLQRIRNGPGLASQLDQCFNIKKRLSHRYIVLEHSMPSWITKPGHVE
ncbi:hypothetical protein D3C81_337240 [compost metagenome]